MTEYGKKNEEDVEDNKKKCNTLMKKQIILT